MKKLIEKLNQNNGMYVFRMSDPEDAEYILQSLGGEELLKARFPMLYQAYDRTLKNVLDDDQSDYEDKISINTTNLTYSASGSGTKFQGLISGFLCDPAINTDEIGLKAARPWQGVSVKATICDSDDPTIPPYSSVTTFAEKTNSFNFQLSTKEEIDEVTVAKSNLSVVTEVVGVDPDGHVTGCAALNNYENHCADGGVRVVDRITLNDPKFKNNSSNNPIIMLYGRGADQNPDYKNADYLGGEYKDNNGGEAGDKDLKTLMPISGQIVFKEGYEFKGLTKPDKKKKKLMYRPTISIGGSQVVKYYQDNWGNDPSVDYDLKMYNDIKDCFKVDPDNKNVCNFDLKINNSVDWKADLKGAGELIKDNTRVLDYQVKAAFRLDVAKGVIPGTVDLTIQYTANKAANLYVTTDGTSVVYIPPVRVYWGCIGKDSMIMTKCGLKAVSEIKSGDKILTVDGAYVTVAQILKGWEKSIYTIRTAKEQIQLTGGHPVLLSSGEEKKAFSLQKGDCLARLNGETSLVTDVIKEDYDDEVFNLLIQENDEGTFIYANGFAVGDADAQNRPLKAPEISYSEEELQLQKELKALSEILGKKE